MSNDNKAPGWSVRCLDFRAGPRWCVYDEHRLICWTEQNADATRIVEAVNGLAEAREDAAEVQVWRDHAGAIDDALGGYSLTLSRVQAVQAVVRERDDLRAELATLREHAAVEHHGDPVPRIESIPAATPASTLTALTQAAERLNATLARHEELLGIAPEPDDDEIAKLRKVVVAVADHLSDYLRSAPPVDSLERRGQDGITSRLMVEVARRLGLKPDCQDLPTVLRALAGGAR